ncbi:MAG: glycerophosphodiester phosphodiesterase family protein [Campylobacterota bacterium]|nr:glycerophosphodiester phosphodiesterase family protein [Campylobacterota bacterium]
MNTKQTFWNNFTKKNILIAHRGARSHYAENTMIAFEASLEKADAIELDVGFSKDGVAVIIHDDTLERTSDAVKHKEFKAPYKVVDYTYEELQKLDFSSWFMDADPFECIKKNKISKEYLSTLPTQRIPTLKEVLLFCKKHQMPVNVEIKDMRDTAFDSCAAKEVFSIIKQLDMASLVLISSFNHQYLKEFYKMAPYIATAALQENEHPKDLIPYLKSIPTQLYHPRITIANKELIETLNSAGFFVNVFTVNASKDKKRFFDYGATAVFTDFLE